MSEFVVALLIFRFKFADHSFSMTAVDLPTAAITKVNSIALT